jgi:enoyl-CoA hydratase/carnithine racemase
VRPANLILTETVGEKKNVALVKLNRPKALNALNDELMTEVCLLDICLFLPNCF